MKTCKHCGCEMVSEGMQKHPMKDCSFEIGSCRREGCPLFGFTYSIGPNIPASPEEAAEFAEFRAELGKGSDYRAGVAAST